MNSAPQLFERRLGLGKRYKKTVKNIGVELYFDILLLSPLVSCWKQPQPVLARLLGRVTQRTVLFYISKMGRVTKRPCVECKGDASVPCFLRGSKYRHQDHRKQDLEDAVLGCRCAFLS